MEQDCNWELLFAGVRRTFAIMGGEERRRKALLIQNGGGKVMNFTERLAKDIARASKMTLPELEDALANSENRTVSQLTALSLARKAAEGGMDAIKMIRELARWEPDKKAPDREEKPPLVEFRVVAPEQSGGTE